MQKGNVISDTFEKLEELAKESAKAVVSEPLSILKQALGTADVEQNTPSPTATTPMQNQTQSPEESLLNKKKIEDTDRVQKLLILHRQRLKEEEAFFEKSSQEAEQKEQLEVQEEQRKEQEEIIQLQRQSAKDAVLSAPTAASGNGPQQPGAVKQAQKLTGTKEVGKSKGD